MFALLIVTSEHLNPIRTFQFLFLLFHNTHTHIQKIQIYKRRCYKYTAFRHFVYPSSYEFNHSILIRHYNTQKHTNSIHFSTLKLTLLLNYTQKVSLHIEFEFLQIKSFINSLFCPFFLSTSK